jgi:hypothetical protein
MNMGPFYSVVFGAVTAFLLVDFIRKGGGR